jgi:serine/threonine protein kinase
MAEVYKVWDMERNVHLAMKVLHADLAEDRIFLRRFKREADTLATLQHPNIVRFYGLEQDDDLVYMLMDYVDGTTLRKEIFQAKAALSLERIQEIMRSVCAALYYAHKSGFVHCDVQPANIMIHSNGIVYVSDFGISRMTEASTATMVGAGTPAYMSPEQIKGDDPTPQMDIYALGIVLFEMLTGGERPFTGENAKTTGSPSEKVRWEQLRMAAPPPSSYNPAITPSMDAIVLKCLDKSPANRYLSAMDLYGDLVTMGNAPVQPKPVQSPAPEPQIRIPIPEQPQYVPAPQEKAIKPQATNRNRLVMGIGAVVIGVLFVAVIIAGNAISLNQKNMRATGTAAAMNMQSTGTQQAEYLFATATKQEKSARSTATKQEQNARATATKQQQNTQATATAQICFDMINKDLANTSWNSIFCDQYSDNQSDWQVGSEDNEYRTGSKNIFEGKLVWNIEVAKKGFVNWDWAGITEPVSDFYASVDAIPSPKFVRAHEAPIYGGVDC